MKVFRGTPGGQVTVEDGGKVVVLSAIRRGKFGWGKDKGGPDGTNLALSLAANVLGDLTEATKVHQRLKHRTVLAWSADGSWTINERELMAHIDDIRDVEKSTAMARTIVNQQPVPVVYEGGAGIGGIPIKRSDKDQGPGPEVPQAFRKPADAPLQAPSAQMHPQPEPHQRPPNGLGEAVPDDWPEKVDGFRATAGDFVTGTRLIYCLVLCGCYSWQDAAQVPEEKLRVLPQWGDALMAEMMEAFRKRNITYVVKEKRQQLVASALSKLTPEEKEAMGLS